MIAVALLIGGVAAAWIVADRRTTLHQAEERTQSVARLIAAHGEAAINDAALITSAIKDDVANWDLEDPKAGRAVWERLRDLTQQSPVVSSAWIVDAQGISRLDTWTFPARPLPATERPYFKRHAAGAPGPVIASDDRPGAVTGESRFTFSIAVRNPDGSLHAIIVVGILTRAFDTLYAATATWPDARAGLFAGSDRLARLPAPGRASPRLFGWIGERLRSDASGSTLVTDNGTPRIVSWHRAANNPLIYAASSQSVSSALAEWRVRSAAVGGAAALAVIGFGLFAWSARREVVARHQALLNEIATREAHHRVKNSLQLMVTLIRLEARGSDATTRSALASVAGRIHTIADVHDLLQTGDGGERLDVSALLVQLCGFLREGYAGAIECAEAPTVYMDARRAVAIGIAVNELVTNAVKHAGSAVRVASSVDGQTLRVTVGDDGPGLPAGFDLRDRSRFGLHAMMTLVDSLGATVTYETGPAGTTFTLTIPIGSTTEAATLNRPVPGRGRSGATLKPGTQPTIH